MDGIVIAGDYKGKNISRVWTKDPNKLFRIELGLFKDLFLNKETVASLEFVQYNGVDLARGKTTVWASITFRDGKRSLISMSEKDYQKLQIALY